MSRVFTVTAAILVIFATACSSCRRDKPPVTVPAPPIPPKAAAPPPNDNKSIREAAFQRGLEAAQNALKLERAGDSAEAQRHFAEAADALKTAQAAGPTSAPIRNNIGVVQSHAGLHDEALKELEEARKQKDVFHDIYTKNLADAYGRADRWEKTAALYRELTEENPGDPTLAAGLVEALATEGISELRRELNAATRSSVQQSALAIAVLGDARAKALDEEALVTFAHAAADRLNIETRDSVAADIERIPQVFSDARNELLEVLKRPESARQPDWWNGNERREEAYVALLNGVARRAELDSREGEAARLYSQARHLAPDRAVSAIPLIEAKIAVPEAVAEVDRLVAQVNLDAEQRATPRVAYRYHRAAAVVYAAANRWEPSLRERGVRYHVEKAMAIASANPLIGDPAEPRGLLDGAPSGTPAEGVVTETAKPEPHVIIGTSGDTPGTASSKSDLPAVQQLLPEPPLFAFDDFGLSTNAKASLDTLAYRMKADPRMSVCVEGHTDWTGSHAYNDDLGKKRAQAVKDHLMRQGVSDGRIGTRSLGKRHPVFDNRTKEGRAKNRRAIVSFDTATCDKR
jgi:outer membrane protein OmpA-like peptidoglycan-associated protein